jgi:hypothetical protein
MFEILLIKNNGNSSYDISPIVGNISWDSNLSLMSTMQFEIIWTDTKLFPVNPCDVGDVVVIMKDNVEINRGMIVNESKSGRDTIQYTAYDYAWLLDKSKSVYQFNKIVAHDAITKILNDFNFPIGNIAPMRTIIDKIYIEKSPAFNINDIIKLEESKTGVKYTAELRQGELYIEPMKDLIITGTFKQADNLGERDVMTNPLGAERTRSIVDMRNRIKVIIQSDNNDKQKASYITTAIEQNESLISRYGLLEETIKLDAEDAAKSREVARILLSRMGKVHESNTIKLMGDVDFKAGRLFVVDEPITGINGTFMIKTCKHNVSNQIHTMSLELVFAEDVA